MSMRSSISRLTRLTTVGLAVVALAACTTPGPRERQAARLVEFESVAGEPVERFHFWDLQRWEVLGPYEIAVWTRVNEAWLIRVDKPCAGLEFAQAIGLSSNQNVVSTRFDAVLFERQRCTIREIRPVDGKALRRLAKD